MTAVAVELAPSSAEDAFALVHGPASGPRATPRIRLVPAPAKALIPRATGAPQPVAPTITARISVLRALETSAPTDDEDAPSAVPSGNPAAIGCSIALAALEVLSGRRPVAQLARWLAPGVYEAVQVRSALTTRVLRPRQEVRRPVVRRFRLVSVVATAHEVTVVADDGGRVRAVALRLEAHRGAWRASALEIG
ncbi:Rv3235 family protein [Cellulomonas sp. URHE0023]|uniref:Rv3235 family protein n=1 Tax=Cellulomonas sp. URHE0023 TaxID=1380354 RepID=UPI00068BD21E|nr:Rv3235 family protein [Cellulomonas sp. URHE0023]